MLLSDAAYNRDLFHKAYEVIEDAASSRDLQFLAHKHELCLVLVYKQEYAWFWLIMNKILFLLKNNKW